jgi:hypothetical protein
MFNELLSLKGKVFTVEDFVPIFRLCPKTGKIQYLNNIYTGKGLWFYINNLDINEFLDKIYESKITEIHDIPFGISLEVVDFYTALKDVIENNVIYKTIHCDEAYGCNFFIDMKTDGRKSISFEAGKKIKSILIPNSLETHLPSISEISKYNFFKIN